MVLTMKRVIQAILIVAFILAFGLILFFLARLRQENLAATLPVAGRIAVLSTVAGEPSPEGSGVAAAQRAKINPEWGETFLDAIDMNLDDDEDLEQVLIVKSPAATEGRIALVVADFQPSTGNYYRLWKGETLATKPNAVVVQPRDLLGDGSLDILCFGIDDSNRQTLTVFKRTSFGSYYQIFSGAGLSITVDEPAEAEAGGAPPASRDAGLSQALQGNAPLKGAATISVFESVQGSASPLDQKRVIYAWSPSQKRYSRETELLVPGGNVEKLYINKILTGRAEDFEAYLKGLWEKEDDKAPSPTYVYFDADERKISIHSEQERQQWDWGGSNASFAGIYASISNSAVPEMLRLLGIDLVGVDRVRIRATAQQIIKFAMKEEWNGVYKRVVGQDLGMGRDVLEKMSGDEVFPVKIQNSAISLPLKPSDFEGYYASDSGISLELQASRFSLARGSIRSKGYFALFRMGDSTILDLNPIDEQSIPSGRFSYIVEVRPGKGPGIGTLVLKHARIRSDMAEQLFEPEIVLGRLIN